MTATDAATEAVADVAEEVADQALNIAEASRGASPRGFALAFGAFLVGAGVGGGVAYLLANRRLETKYSKIANDEIAEMREHYRVKTLALESEAAKRPVEEIVKEKGYTSPDARSNTPPMAVAPPSRIVQDAKDATIEAEDEAAGEPPDEPETQVRNVFEEHGGNVEDTWDWAEERKKRSPDTPYVIHYEERDEMEGYHVATLTYYEADDVVCDERDEIKDANDRERIIGEASLEQFGHGSNDPSVVYVRNDKLEIVYEVIRSDKAYAEEVHGFSHTYDRGNLERMRAREKEQLEEDDS